MITGSEMTDTLKQFDDPEISSVRMEKRPWTPPLLQSLGSNDDIAASDGPDNDGGELASTS